MCQKKAVTLLHSYTESSGNYSYTYQAIIIMYNTVWKRGVWGEKPLAFPKLKETLVK